MGFCSERKGDLFGLTIVSLLKLLEIDAFLEAFHVPSFSRQGYSLESLAETLK